jgi:hypothetical protein
MEIKSMSRQTMINFALALAICLGLSIMVSLAGILPCSYHDAANGKFAGYGYHSLVKVASEGLEWDSQTVPEQSPLYSGTGPFVASAEYWIVLLYIPIFMAIIFLGWLIMGGKKRLAKFIRPSKKSG